jgi:hypothetical protein
LTIGLGNRLSVVYMQNGQVLFSTGTWPMDLNFPVFATGVRIFRASNDVGPLFLGPGFTPPFSNFLFTNLFSMKFLYFFIISSLFPYFNLFVSIFIQSYVNIKLHVSTWIISIYKNT